MNHNLRIIFFGTSDFAISSLEILIKNNFNIVAVVTIPDKPQGRGKKILPSPVKIAALKYDLPIIQPNKLDDKEFLERLKALSPDLQIVVAFKILPKNIWNLPKFGTINLHASILPEYRGAAPINWALINGEKETGVTTFFIDENIDTGKIAFTEKEDILINDTFETLYNKLKIKGAHLILKTVKSIEDKSCPEIIQPKTTKTLKKAPKITKEICEINWNDSAEGIYNFIRGLSPIPGAWTIIKNRRVKIFFAEISKSYKLDIKEIKTDNKSFLLIGTSTFPISIKIIQEEGKKVLKINEFLKGNKF